MTTKEHTWRILWIERLTIFLHFLHPPFFLQLIFFLPQLRKIQTRSYIKGHKLVLMGLFATTYSFALYKCLNVPFHVCRVIYVVTSWNHHIIKFKVMSTNNTIKICNLTLGSFEFDTKLGLWNMLDVDRKWLHDHDSFFPINCQQTQYVKSRIEPSYFSHLNFFKEKNNIGSLYKFTFRFLQPWPIYFFMNLKSPIYLFMENSEIHSKQLSFITNVRSTWHICLLARFEVVEFRSSLFPSLICPLLNLWQA